MRCSSRMFLALAVLAMVASAALGQGPPRRGSPRSSGLEGKTLAKDLFGRAGITPQEVDVLQIYDHFTGLVLMTLENFGFCGRGEAGSFATAGNLRWPNGRFPLNTSGGHLSEAYIHGLNLACAAIDHRGIPSRVDGSARNDACFTTRVAG